jgi:copper chaperone CopZ
VEQAWRGEGNVVEVTVWEMMCQGCEMAVEEAAEAVDGVVAAEAKHETSLLRVKIADPTRREAVIAALRDALHENGRQIVGEDPIPD